MKTTDDLSRDTHEDLAQAQESLEQAQRDLREQKRKATESSEVSGRLEAIGKENNIAMLIRDALQHHGQTS